MIDIRDISQLVFNSILVDALQCVPIGECRIQFHYLSLCLIYFVYCVTVTTYFIIEGWGRGKEGLHLATGRLIIITDRMIK